MHFSSWSVMSVNEKAKQIRLYNFIDWKHFQKMSCKKTGKKVYCIYKVITKTGMVLNISIQIGKKSQLQDLIKHIENIRI